MERKWTSQDGHRRFYYLRDSGDEVSVSIFSDNTGRHADVDITSGRRGILRYLAGHDARAPEWSGRLPKNLRARHNHLAWILSVLSWDSATFGGPSYLAEPTDARRGSAYLRALKRAGWCVSAHKSSGTIKFKEEGKA